MNAEEKLLNAIFGESKWDSQKAFKEIIETFINKGFEEAYKTFDETIKKAKEIEFENTQNEYRDFVAYENVSKKTIVLKFEEGEKEFTYKAKCDESDSYNRYAGVAIGLMKHVCGFNSNSEFKKFIDSKIVSVKKQEKGE